MNTNTTPLTAPRRTGINQNRWLEGCDYFHAAWIKEHERDGAVKAISHYLFYGHPERGIPPLGYGREEQRAQMIIEWYDRLGLDSEDRATKHAYRVAEWRNGQRRQISTFSQRAADKYQANQIANDKRRRTARAKIIEALEECERQGFDPTQTRVSKISGCDAKTVKRHLRVLKGGGVLTQRLDILEITVQRVRVRSKFEKFQERSYYDDWCIQDGIDPLEDELEAQELKQWSELLESTTQILSQHTSVGNSAVLEDLTNQSTEAITIKSSSQDLRKVSQSKKLDPVSMRSSELVAETQQKRQKNESGSKCLENQSRGNNQDDGVCSGILTVFPAGLVPEGLAERDSSEAREKRCIYAPVVELERHKCQSLQADQSRPNPDRSRVSLNVFSSLSRSSVHRRLYPKRGRYDQNLESRHTARNTHLHANSRAHENAGSGNGLQRLSLRSYARQHFSEVGNARNPSRRRMRTKPARDDPPALDSLAQMGKRKSPVEGQAVTMERDGR